MLIDEMREPRDWCSLIAALGTLSLAVTVTIAGKRSPLSRPLAALSFALFGWNFMTLAGHLVGRSGHGNVDAFVALDAAFTALSPAFVLQFVLAFVGGLKRFRALRIGAFVAFGTLALASLGGVFSTPLVEWTNHASWMVIFFLLHAPLLAFEIVILVRHLREGTDSTEKARTRMVLAALAVGSMFATSDIARGAGLPVPYLGSIGTLLTVGLLVPLVVRFSLLDENVPARTAIYVLGLIIAAFAGYFVVLSVFAGSVAFQLFAVVAISLVLSAATRELVISFGSARARAQRLATLGRFSAQMSHDMKGPIAALLGAVQVLDEATDEKTRNEFLGLVGEQAKRIVAVVDRYDRMARIEPRKIIVRLDEIVRAAARVHGVETLVVRELECDGDPALLESAIENVVRNAVEATHDTKKVRIEMAEHTISIVDEGPGMDARILERAGEDFFTTKTEGSGLGLSFARRVLEAHGGSLRISSRTGEGTTVSLVIPRAPEPLRR